MQKRCTSAVVLRAGWGGVKYNRKVNYNSRNSWIFPLNAENCSKEKLHVTWALQWSAVPPYGLTEILHAPHCWSVQFFFPWIVQVCIPSYRLISSCLVHNWALVYSFTYKPLWDTVCTVFTSEKGAQQAEKRSWGWFKERCCPLEVQGGKHRIGYRGWSEMTNCPFGGCRCWESHSREMFLYVNVFST